LILHHIWGKQILRKRSCTQSHTKHKHIGIHCGNIKHQSSYMGTVHIHVSTHTRPSWSIWNSHWQLSITWIGGHKWYATRLVCTCLVELVQRYLKILQEAIHWIRSMSRLLHETSTNRLHLRNIKIHKHVLIRSPSLFTGANKAAGNWWYDSKWGKNTKKASRHWWKIPKKLKTQDGKLQWKDNKKYDSTLKSVKQTIVQVHKKINLGMLIMHMEQQWENCYHSWVYQQLHVVAFCCGVCVGKTVPSHLFLSLYWNSLFSG